MALSVYNSNWAPLQHLNFPADITTNIAGFPGQQSLQEQDMEQLLGFQENLFYPENPYTTSIDPLFHDPINHDLILPYLAPPPPLDNSFPPQPFEHSYHYQNPGSAIAHSYLKRQKCYEDEYYYDYGYYLAEDVMPSLKPDVFVPNPPLLMTPEFSLLPNLPEIYGQGFDYGCGDEEGSSGKSGGGGGSLSAQSMAARQRRRKITEKTQELGKLIPGGHKMNTAEMFHAASKYIKYLQAQVGILEFMGSTQENEEPLHGSTRELQALAISPTIQEKLYSLEKFLVPKQLVEALENDHPQLLDTQATNFHWHPPSRTRHAHKDIF